MSKAVKRGQIFTWMVEGGSRYPTGMARVRVKHTRTHRSPGKLDGVQFVWYQIMQHPRFRRGEVRSCRADLFLKKVEG